MDWAERKYHSLYRELDFERKGLFHNLRELLGDKAVLYPGCSFHITPSFYFSRVTYADKSEEAVRFFQQREAVARIIQREKTYKKACHFEFVQATFGKDHLPFKREFELLISLLAGNVAEHFLPFLKPGAYILTSNHFSGAKYFEGEQFKLLYTISANRKGQYRLSPSQEQKPLRNRLIKDNQKFRFDDRQTYFVYKAE